MCCWVLVLPWWRADFYRKFLMYSYTEFDRTHVRLRAVQFRDQLERWQAGTLSDEAFKPLRLQNGWYVQRFAPMLRVAVPYGEINAQQLRVLARIAREFDDRSQHDLSPFDPGLSDITALPFHCAHFTTRQNVQFNWIPLHRAADVMDLLASVNMHGIQTSGNCIRNTTTDAFAGIAPDELADPRPFAELIRQWSTLHPEFSHLPRKFKVAITGALEDRAAVGWHDIGLRLKHDELGTLGFQVQVGGGMGRTPLIGPTISPFVPWYDVLNYLEAVLRTYNAYGRRDNAYKARIKILVKAEGQRFVDAVEREFQAILNHDGGHHRITVAELERMQALFEAPDLPELQLRAPEKVRRILEAAALDDKGFERWLQNNVHGHKNPYLRAVTLSFKRLGFAPGDATADQLEAAAELIERFSAGEARISHEQNMVLPWVPCEDLPELWREARRLGLAKPNVGLLTDMIACPGGDFCALANARSLPIASAVTERFQDMDELHDLGPIDLHISGCMNSCGHHHSGHIGILGVDKDGQEWYQITVGGSDGSTLSGTATPGRVVGPAFAADEVVDAIEALLDTYRHLRETSERFIQVVQRVGLEPFKTATQRVRTSTARVNL